MSPAVSVCPVRYKMLPIETLPCWSCSPPCDRNRNHSTITLTCSAVWLFDTRTLFYNVTSIVLFSIFYCSVSSRLDIWFQIKSRGADYVSRKLDRYEAHNTVYSHCNEGCAYLLSGSATALVIYCYCELSWGLWLWLWRKEQRYKSQAVFKWSTHLDNINISLM